MVSPTEDHPTVFRHLGVRAKKHPSGTLSCVPVPTPADAILGADSWLLHIRINHSSLASRVRPRRAEAVAELESLIAAHAGRIGIVSTPFASPSAWVRADVHRVFMLMLEHLACPACDATLSILNRAWTRQTLFRASRSDDGLYGEVAVDSSAVSRFGFSDWQGRMAKFEEWSRAADSVDQPAVRPRPVGDFQHPSERPDADVMLTELSEFRSDHGFGSHSLWSANESALRIETELYNDWVRMQCQKLNLRSPGSLSAGDFRERFWKGDA